jgi:U3 small nucleolar RNA-associated protein 3
MRALRQYMNSIEQRGGANQKGEKRKRGADDDAPVRTREDRAARHAARAGAAEAEASSWGGGDDDDYDYGGGGGKRAAAIPEEDPFYAEMAAQQKQRKASRSERRAAADQETVEARRAAPAGDVAGDGEAREAGRQIEKNRGLTRERKKIDANPRVKNREKFRKATIRRKGQVRGVSEGASGPYAGEATGIKKNVSHSTRF